jgi:hypothetical protein
MLNRSILSAVSLAAALAGAAQGQFFVRGEFNNWTNATQPMTPSAAFPGYLNASHQYTVTGLVPGQAYAFKATINNWSRNAPGTDAKVVANAQGEITVFMHDNWPGGVPTFFDDGYEPVWDSTNPLLPAFTNGLRLGYADSEMHGWEVMGSPNAWAAPLATMTSEGNGRYSAVVRITNGLFVGDAIFGPIPEYKFRKAGDWSIAIGRDFGSGAPNQPYVFPQTSYQALNGEPIRFELDLPMGRTRIARWSMVCPADLNADAAVDDQLICPLVCFDEFFCYQEEFCPADLNHDLFVDDADFVLFATAYNALLCE